MTDLFEKRTPKKINPHGLKSGDIRKAMSKRWTDPEWAIMWEVNQGTGGNMGRSADAVMMSLWPSRGLELHGVEIKVSRSDWKREAADPTKAEAVAQFCDRWWIHTPEGVVDDLSDIPPAWGLREYTGKQWRTIREAERTDAKPVTRAFLAAMLRRADGLMKGFIHEATQDARQAAYDERQKLDAQFSDRVKQEVSRRTSQYQRAEEQFKAFEDAFGDGLLGSYQDLSALGRTAKAILEAQNRWSSDPISTRLQRAADAARELEGIGTATPIQGVKG